MTRQPVDPLRLHALGANHVGQLPTLGSVLDGHEKRIPAARPSRISGRNPPPRAGDREAGGRAAGSRPGTPHWRVARWHTCRANACRPASATALAMVGRAAGCGRARGGSIDAPHDARVVGKRRELGGERCRHRDRARRPSGRPASSPRCRTGGIGEPPGDERRSGIPLRLEQVLGERPERLVHPHDPRAGGIGRAVGGERARRRGAPRRRRASASRQTAPPPADRAASGGITYASGASAAPLSRSAARRSGRCPAGTAPGTSPPPAARPASR